MIKMLMISVHLDDPGGVASFVSMLKKYFSNNIDYNGFYIGKRGGTRGALFRYLYPLADAIRLFVNLFLNRYDVVTINPSFNTFSVLRDGLFLLILRVLRIKCVLVFHGWDHSLERRIERRTLLKSAFRKTYSYPSHVFVLSEDFRSWLISIGIESGQITVITTMFDDEEFTNLPSGTQDYQRLLFLSRIIPEKGVFNILDAFIRVGHDYPDAKLVFAGSGPAESALKKMAESSSVSSRIQFKGYVKGADKVETFAEAGVFVFPSDYGEGCPVSLLEAMATGLPLITTPVGGIAGIVKNNENGVVLQESSVDSIVAAIRHLFDQPELSKRIGELNKAKAWSEFSASKMSAFFESVFSKVAAK